MLNNEILAQMRKQFDEFKKTFKINATFEEIDNAFYIQDCVLEAGYVSPYFSQQICSRIGSVFMNWNNYLHGLVMPDAHYLIQMNESKVMTQDEKKEILDIIGRSMAFVSTNLLLHAQPDALADARFIDDSLTFWKEVYSLKLISFIEKIRGRWST